MLFHGMPSNSKLAKRSKNKTKVWYFFTCDYLVNCDVMCCAFVELDATYQVIFKFTYLDMSYKAYAFVSCLEVPRCLVC